MTRIVDLFSGVGGFSEGFKQNNFIITKAVEFDNEIATSYSLNHEDTIMLNKDISKICIDNYFDEGECEVIIGGPPCQGFSMVGHRSRRGFVDDPRNYLFRKYYEVVKVVKPDVFVIENVKGIISSQRGQIFKEIKEIFREEGYYVDYRILNAKDFGIPQNRERVFIFGSKKKFNLEKMVQIARKNILKRDSDFFDTPTIKDVIGNLPKPTETGIVSVGKPKTPYQEYLYSEETTVHTIRRHSTKTLDRIKKIKPGNNFSSLSEEIGSVYSGSYGRLESNGISNTITTRFDTPSGGKFIHPLEDRTITPREAARIQSFKDEYVFFGTNSSIGKQIGNAVPPKLAFFISEVVKGILND